MLIENVGQALGEVEGKLVDQLINDLKSVSCKCWTRESRKTRVTVPQDKQVTQLQTGRKA